MIVQLAAILTLIANLIVSLAQGSSILNLQNSKRMGLPFASQLFAVNYSPVKVKALYQSPQVSIHDPDNEPHSGLTQGDINDQYNYESSLLPSSYLSRRPIRDLHDDEAANFSLDRAQGSYNNLDSFKNGLNQESDNNQSDTTNATSPIFEQPNGDASDTVPPYMQHMTIILVILHLSVFITGLVGNSLVCLSVYRNKSLQTVTNYYIVNLAVADFLVILICLPPTVYWDLTLTWNFGLVLCKLVLYLQSISVSVSVLTLTCISIDRWYAICRPLEFCSTKYRAKVTIALIWLVSMIIASPDVMFLTTRPLYEENNYIYMDCTYSWPESSTKVYQLCIVTLLFLGPFVLMSISYSHIVNVLWRNETMADSMQNSVQLEDEQQFLKRTNNESIPIALSTQDDQVQSRCVKPKMKWRRKRTRGKKGSLMDNKAMPCEIPEVILSKQASRDEVEVHEQKRASCRNLSSSENGRASNGKSKDCNSFTDMNSQQAQCSANYNDKTISNAPLTRDSCTGGGKVDAKTNSPTILTMATNLASSERLAQQTFVKIEHVNKNDDDKGNDNDIKKGAPYNDCDGGAPVAPKTCLMGLNVTSQSGSSKQEIASDPQGLASLNNFAMAKCGPKGTPSESQAIERRQCDRPSAPVKGAKEVEFEGIRDRNWHSWVGELAEGGDVETANQDNQRARLESGSLMEGAKIVCEQEESKMELYEEPQGKQSRRKQEVSVRKSFVGGPGDIEGESLTKASIGEEENSCQSSRERPNNGQRTKMISQRKQEDKLILASANTSKTRKLLFSTPIESLKSIGTKLRLAHKIESTDRASPNNDSTNNNFDAEPTSEVEVEEGEQLSSVSPRLVVLEDKFSTNDPSDGMALKDTSTSNTTEPPQISHQSLSIGCCRCFLNSKEKRKEDDHERGNTKTKTTKKRKESKNACEDKTSKKYRKNLANYAAQRDKYRNTSVNTGRNARQAMHLCSIIEPKHSRITRLENSCSVGHINHNFDGVQKQQHQTHGGMLPTTSTASSLNLGPSAIEKSAYLGEHQCRHSINMEGSHSPGASNGRSSLMVNQTHASNQARFYKLIESRKKAAKMLIVIVIMFGLCYLPIHFLNILRYTIGLPQNDITTIASLVSHWLCYFNSAVNPLIYNLMSGKFRHEFANLFFCKCFRRGNGN